MDYQELSKNIIESIGGERNVQDLKHCSTRLRFKVKDLSLVQKEELKNVKGVKGVKDQQQGIQVIIGQEVDEVFGSIMEMYTFNAEEKN